MGEIDLLGIGKFATAAKEPILKLMELCECAIGKIYEPTHVVRMAKAHAEEIKLISAVSRENTDVPILYSKGDIEIDTTSGQELAIRTQTRLQLQELQKQQNIESVISHAYEELGTEETVSSEPVDTDWATRLFSIAGEVSNEDLQLLWGKVLSGEVKQPGSYSLRTLDRLRNLSKEEAELFSRIANCVFQYGSTFFVHTDKEILKSENIFYADILTLDGAGLVTTDYLTITIPVTQNTERNIIKFGSKLLFLKRNNEQVKEIKVSCYALTQAGVEIYSIIDKCFKENYLKDVATKLKEQNISITYNEIIKINADNSMNYEHTGTIL
ncbi:DUF2806 domain-containing protein [Clostridium tagluense]|uniref:DUF2806 domain-containing protein n=1 Tax=Clostridium tagluense TaxID=360422 RepID=A0A401UU59_9CLOT|nr:DUF2806 domain-containing protein [Clostridium tagluense]GCD13077.1 hypothetical protein Ctaglu_47000 [Clostridium tagluense]